eukprot:3734281-Rhodomonas_salina.1
MSPLLWRGSEVGRSGMRESASPTGLRAPGRYWMPPKSNSSRNSSQRSKRSERSGIVLKYLRLS